jgi:glycosyltransferase involved in cell wall biosynthesis
MNVLHLVQHFKIGGLEKMAVTLMQKSQFSHNSLIVSLEGKEQDAIKEWPALAQFGHQMVSLNKAPKFDLTVLKKLGRLIKEHNIHLIHSHHVGPMLYASLVCMTNKHVRHVSTIHDAWYLNNFKQRVITKALNGLTKINWVADAKVVANDFYQQTAIKADKTILNGIDFQQFTHINEATARSQLGLPQDKKLIGCSARLEPGKGHLDLIKLLPELDDDIQLVFAGNGSLMLSLQNAASVLGVLERVHFLGNVQQMQLFYSAISVMCLYSQREGLPLSILESMACGKVIVASDVGGISEVVTQEQGILIGLNDPVGLKVALLKAINMKQGQCIREYIFSIADADKMSKAYDHFYNGLAL